MSIKLTTLCFNIINLTSIEKHLLIVFCFRANDKQECWSSIDRLMIDTAYSKNTVEKSLKKLRDKKILNYTGSYKGSSQRIPVYKIDLDHPILWGDKYFITPYWKGDHPTEEGKITPPRGVHKDNVKNNRKDNEKFSLFTPQTPKTQSPGVLDFQEHKAGKKGYEWVGEWMLENK